MGHRMEQRLVFVIDDYPGVLRLVEAELADLGCVVDTFPEASQAATAVRDGRQPALVLVDPWCAPDDDPLHRNLLGLTDRDSLIVMSGTRDTAAIAEEQGLSLLWKPFDRAALVDAVMSALPAPALSAP